jgi:hypothetical protein
MERESRNPLRHSNETFESICTHRFMTMMHRCDPQRLNTRGDRKRGNATIVPAKKIDFCSRFGLFTRDFDGD